MTADSSTAKRSFAPNPFVGRAQELQVLDAVLADALRGRGSLALLSGESGIGKTRLAIELGERARARHAAVCWGRCWDDEGAPAFWPWVQMVRQYIAGRDAQELRSDLGTAVHEVTRMIPDLGLVLDQDAPNAMSAGLVTTAEHQRFRFFDGLTRFWLAASRRQPIVLVFDDLQWADVASLRLWEFFARDIGGGSLAMLALYRDDEVGPGHPLYATLGAITREPTCRSMVLSGLSKAEIACCVEMLSGRPLSLPLLSTVAQRTEGNPFFLRELVQLVNSIGGDVASWQQALPVTVRQVVGRRLRALPADCNHLLELAAAIGRECDVDLLATVAEAHAGDVAIALEPALSAGLLQQLADSNCYSFAHAMVHETVYQQLSAATRPWLHRRIGESLEAGAGDPAAHVAELARHFALAGRDHAMQAKALDYARRAGDAALHALAYENAIRFYERALTLLEQQPAPDPQERCALLLKLEEAQMRAGHLAAARASSLRAAAYAGDAGLDEIFARAALGFGWQFEAGVVDDDRIAVLREALDRIGGEHQRLRAKLMARLAVALYFVPDSYETRAQLSAQAVEAARSCNDAATLAFALNARLFALWVPDASAVRLALAQELLQLAEDCGDEELALQSQHWLVLDTLEAGDIDATRRHIAAHAVAATRLRQPLYLWFASKWRASLATLEGRFADAEAEIPAAYAISNGIDKNAHSAFLTQIFGLRTEQGDLAAFADAAQVSDVDGAFEAASACGRALLFAEADRLDAMREEIMFVARAGIENIPHDPGWLPANALLAVAVAKLGDASIARALYAQLQPYSGRIVIAGILVACYGAVDRYLGLLATVLQQWHDAERHFSAALALNQRLRARTLVARTQYEWAAMLLYRRQVGDADRAQALLTEGLAITRELGMESVRARIEALLAMLASSASDQTGRREDPREGARAIETPETENREPAFGTGPGISTFRSHGDVWRITFAGESCELRDARGLHYLEYLLLHPGREIHAADLVNAIDGLPTGATAPGQIADSLGPDLGSTMVLVDATAAAQYQRRLSDLRAELAEADDNCDLGRSARLREELAMLTEELAHAGRRQRRTSHAERARVAVTKATRLALARIARALPALGAHLDATVRTGYYCSYTPDPLLRIQWRDPSERA